MSKLTVINARSLEKLLLTLGFKAVRKKGSHVFYRHKDGRYTTLPHHKGKDLSRPLIRAILKEIKLTVEEYNSLLKKH